MKNIKKLFLCIVMAVITLCMAACNPYVSSYKASKMNTNNMGDHSYLQFFDLEGRYVLKMKASDGGSEGVIQFTGELEYGEINVYYDCLGVKEVLFNIKGGEMKTDATGYIERNKKVYIIIETVEKAQGSLTFDLVLY